MSRRNKPVTFGRVLLHFTLGLLTGGLWWLWLAVKLGLTLLNSNRRAY